MSLEPFCSGANFMLLMLHLKKDVFALSIKIKIYPQEDY
jgi:hypothetical protein